MKQEDKELLLLQDLCGRLPYGVKCEVYNRIGVLDEISSYGVGVTYDNGQDTTCRIEYVKPYLFPLSSMTEEQKKEFKEISKCKYEIGDYGGFDSEGVYLIEIGKYEYEYDIDTTIEEFYFNHEIINWLNKNHFDYRGLIEKGLAIDCTNLNIY
jgi:hypothetical protein